ncbi:MAG: GNAT family N-acetyltransferase [Pyrinomonadaceae bacterium]|nr:GNAT family N-acetyltransferase [Blastocatellia bacterium]MCW5956395.1 GNAT family N-acetyltransferase [Pyrinomonadaceae bacterium]
MIETERLKFRRLTFDDLPLLIEQRSDPEVNKYLGGTRLQNPEAIEKRLKFYISCYEKFGFGNCVMIWKEDGRVIGTAGLQPLEDSGEIEVGYSMIKEFWGRGIGTEAARGWLEYGFNVAGLERIVAVAMVGNAASRRIMEKLGMRFEKDEMHYDELCAYYGVSKQEFFARQY